jgi:hypothetical protein
MLLVADCQRISEKLLVDPAAVWEMHGESVLECLALTDPGKLATIVAEKMSS